MTAPMTAPGSRDDWFADNRANWDDRAAVHEASGYGISELLAGGTVLSPVVARDRKLLGSLEGQDVIHLQCHLGTDTLSLSRLGAARTVGLDLSGESLRRARALADRAGAEIEFVEANVYDARDALEGSFDLVYTSVGVLCWLPDIAQWAQVVCSLLRPGGRLYLRDVHPLMNAIGDDVSTGLRLEHPYFETPDPLTGEDGASYVEAPEGSPEITHGRNHQWGHGVGEILTALLSAGLVLDHVEESRHTDWARWPELMTLEAQGWTLREHADRLPLELIVLAHRPEGS